MKISNAMRWAAMFLLSFLPFSFVHAQVNQDLYSFNITQGKVAIQAVFCIPESCEFRQGSFTGSFEAAFVKDKEIRLSNIKIISDLDFTLPEDPHTDVNGAVYDASYSFDGRTLYIEGIIDSSAFDGPIVRYNLTAALADVDVGFDPHGYYLARQDFRKCAAPMCGGIYVKPVNTQRMQCPDGRTRNECYIGTPDWGKLGFNPFAEVNSSNLNSQILLKGDVESDGEFGRFLALDALAPAGKNKTKGTYFGVENNGIVCISSPCFSFDEYTLNTKRSQAISDVDFSRTGASEKAIQTAYELMAEGDAVIIVGENRRYRGFSGIGVRLVASQFYLPIRSASTGECAEGYALGKLGCETRNGCLFPLLEQTVYGGARPVDGEIPLPKFECVLECKEPALPVSPGYCALHLP